VNDLTDSGNSKQKIWLLAGVSVLAAAIVAVAIVISQSGSDDSDSSKSSSSAGNKSGAASFLDGIPQEGTMLGDPKAPVVMSEFADLQCPHCREFSKDVFPELVEKYIKPGKLRMDLKLLRFINPESHELARAAYGAAEQNKLWQFADLALDEQASIGISDEDLTKLGDQIDGLDMSKVLKDRDLPKAEEQIAGSEKLAEENGVTGTPAFLVSVNGGKAEVFSPDDLTPEPFTKELDKLLKEAKK